MTREANPDGIRVRLLEPKDQNGRPTKAQSSHGALGEVVVLSAPVAKDLIAQGCAEQV